MAAAVAVVGASDRPNALSRRVKRMAVLIVAACLIAFLGFLAGEHHRRPAATTTVLTGVATVGDHMASIVVGGRVYGVEGNVPWLGQDGTTHTGSWPACLGAPGNTVRVTFGEVPATLPDGTTTRQVDWVDCQS